VAVTPWQVRTSRLDEANLYPDNVVVALTDGIRNLAEISYRIVESIVPAACNKSTTMYAVCYFLHFFFFFSDSRFPHGRVGVRGMRYTDQRRVVDGRLFREYRLSYTNV